MVHFGGTDLFGRRFCLQYLDLIAVKTRVFFGTLSLRNIGTD